MKWHGKQNKNKTAYFIIEFSGRTVVKAKIKAIFCDTYQLQCIKLHHSKLERFKSI